jgi:hypothetical protein
MAGVVIVPGIWTVVHVGPGNVVNRKIRLGAAPMRQTAEDDGYTSTHRLFPVSNFQTCDVPHGQLVVRSVCMRGCGEHESPNITLPSQ